MDQGFLPKFDYQVKSECTCAPFPVLEDVVICEEKDLDYRLSNCNKKIEFLKDIQFCDPSNFKLAPKYLGKPTGKPNTLDDLAYAQIKFLIEINGSVVDTLEADDLGKLKLIGKTYEVQDATGITSLRFFTKDGSDKDACVLEQTFTAVDNPLPTVQQICLDGKVQAIFSGANITKVKYLDTLYNPNANITLSGDGEQTFTIVYSNGCELEYKHTFNCCALKDITIAKGSTPISTDNVVSGIVSYNLTKTGFSPSSQYVLEQSSNAATIEGTTLKVNVDLISQNTNYSVTVKVSEAGCDKSKTLVLSKQNVRLTVSEDGCGEGTLTLNGDPNEPFKIKYLSSIIEGNLDGNGVFTTSTNNGVSITGVVYSLTEYKGTTITGTSVTYTKLGAPAITAVTLSNFDTCTNTAPAEIKLKVTGTGLSTATKVTYQVGTSTSFTNLTQEAGIFYLKIPNTFTDKLNVTITNIENTGCSVPVNLVYTFTLKQQSQVDIVGSCNGTANYQYVLSSNDADSITISSSLPSGSSYNPTTKTLTTGFNSNFSITVSTTKDLVGETVTRCPITIQINSPASSSCACTQLPAVVSTSPVCALPTNIAYPGYKMFKPETPIIFDFSSVTTPMTYNPSQPTTSNFIISSGWTGFSGSVNALPTDFTFVNNVLTIREFGIPTTSNITSGLVLFAISPGFGNYCPETTTRISTGTLQITDVSYVKSALNNYVDLVITNSVGGEVLRQTLSYLKVNKFFEVSASSDYDLKFEFKSGTIFTSVPSNFTIEVNTGSSVLTYTKQNIVDGVVNPVILSSILNLEVSAGSCHNEIIDNIEVQKEGDNPITISINGVVTYGNQVYCRNSGILTFTHEFTGQPGVTTDWSILGQNSNSGTFTLDTSSTVYPATPLLVPVVLFVTKDGVQYSSTNLLYIRLQDPLPITIVYSSDLTQNSGTYPLPVPVGIPGTWRNSSNLVVGGVDTDTLTPGTYTFTYTPTGCYQPFSATIKINAVGSLNVTGASTGCESSVLTLTVGESGTVYYSKGTLSLSSVPPTSPQAITTLSVGAGDTNVTITSSGNYDFVFLPNSNPSISGYSPKVAKAMTINSKSNILDDGSIPNTFFIGETYTLPTSLNGVSGVWKLNGSVVTAVNNTTTNQTRVYTFEPTGCFNNFTKTITILCPTDKTMSISGLTDPCSATLTLSSDFYNSFSTLINGSIVVVGSSISRASFSQDSNTIQVTATKTGTTCEKVFNFTYDKCATCVLGVCDPCSGNSDTVVTVLNSSPLTNNSIVINTPNNIAITSVTKTSAGAVSATVGSQTTNDKTVTIFKTFSNPCGDAGLDTVTINYDVILNTPSGTVLCPKTFSYNYTLPSVTYVNLDAVPGAYAIQDSNWVQVSGYGQNITYNSSQTFTVSGPDLVDGTVEFLLELLADNYAAVSVNGNFVGSVGINGSNNTSGFTSIHQFPIDKADLLSGSNSIEITHYNANEVMGLYIKIYRLVDESIDSTIYNARTDKPILVC